VLRKPGMHEVIRMEGHSFSSVSTPDHRWLTNRLPNSKPGTDGVKLPQQLWPIASKLPKTSRFWTWRTTETLTADDRIPQAVPCAELPTVPKYTDAFVELVAWIWTEGSQEHGAFVVHQSHKVNEPNCLRIRRALNSLDPNRTWTERTDNWGMSHFAFNWELSKAFWPVFKNQHHKVVATEFILSLTEAQLRLFVDVSVLGDGHDGLQRWVRQNKKEQLAALELACILLGTTTSLRHIPSNGMWQLSLKTQQFVNPKRAVYNAGSQGMRIGKEVYVGEVWCVTTRNGNWLSKRSGYVCYTGNTYDKQALVKKNLELYGMT
jgi:hypothetical protein